MITSSQLPDIMNGKFAYYNEELTIEHLVTDSRRAVLTAQSVFFAIKGSNHDGHQFIGELYLQGIRQFVVETKELDISNLTNANIILVDSTLSALQSLVAYKRNQVELPVIGITGSNGKTIVKEWLSKVLASHFKVISNPKSYNSQLGVPLSVWNLEPGYELGIFEAGISAPDEMARLAAIIKPTLGIFTNLGSAHDAGFSSRNQKVAEKASLFQDASGLIYCRDHELVDQELQKRYGTQASFYHWSQQKDAWIKLNQVKNVPGGSELHLSVGAEKMVFALPFQDWPSLENSMQVICAGLSLGLLPASLQTQLNQLQKVKMRLELKYGVNDAYLIDDSYNNDLAGLKSALDFLDQQQQKQDRTLILSDVLQSGLPGDTLYHKVAQLIGSSQVKELIAIGPQIAQYVDSFDIPVHHFDDTSQFLSGLNQLSFQNKMILVKGARVFGFEKIVDRLQQKLHGTRLEINLDALTHNLNFYRSRLQPGVKLMVMVKAFAYGSGITEVANLLQFHRIDYLSVAYADEGITLRQNGIRIPVMVMNPSPESFEKMVDYELEPEIYSLSLLKSFLEYTRHREKIAAIHLKLETGMNRLGFAKADLDALLDLLHQYPNALVNSIFSHLAGADESLHNDYSHQQVALFEQNYNYLQKKLSYKPLRHMLNSAGIIRFPDYQFDMVRLGIGLYGVEANQLYQNQLEPVSTLKTIVSQVKNVKKGQTVGYSRKGVVEHNATIATIAIGYADGFSRAFSNGKAEVLINGQRAPVIGNVCMDMTMVDVTGIEAREGDEVIIFGPGLPVQELSDRIGTIPYEILTSVGERVKRIFYLE